MRICVTYLLREQAHAQPFLDSYQAHDSGHDHTLMFLTKGKRATLPPSGACIPNHLEMFANDFGRDLHAYGKVCRAWWRDFDAFCFLNSYSVILWDNWLALLVGEMEKWWAMTLPETGLVGATFSTQSFLSNSRGAGWARRKCYAPHPNYHVRTNAFLIRSQLMKAIWPRWILTKDQAHLFESGRDSLTNRVAELGYRAVGLTNAQSPTDLIVGDNHVRESIAPTQHSVMPGGIYG